MRHGEDLIAEHVLAALGRREIEHRVQLRVVLNAFVHGRGFVVAFKEDFGAHELKLARLARARRGELLRERALALRAHALQLPLRRRNHARVELRVVAHIVDGLL
jgi:hypothetical protein